MIPVLFYHSIGTYSYRGSVHPREFEKQLQWLKRNGYETVFISDVVKWMRRKKKLDKAVCITFDDGYLDNWVYAYPLLKKYGMKANIFIITERIGTHKKRAKHPDKLPRLKSMFQANKDYVDRGSTTQFISHDEIKEMVQSNVIEVHSHTKTHDRFFCSPKIEKFNVANNDWWLKIATHGDERRGIPVLKHNSSVVSKQFIPDKQSFQKAFVYFKGKPFKKLWPFRIKGEYEKHFEKRVVSELKDSKKVIDRYKKSTILCWPFGDYSNKSIALGKKAGFDSFITTDLGSCECGGDVTRIPRVEILGSYDISTFGSVVESFSSSSRPLLWYRITLKEKLMRFVVSAYHLVFD